MEKSKAYIRPAVDDRDPTTTYEELQAEHYKAGCELIACLKKRKFYEEQMVTHGMEGGMPRLERETDPLKLVEGVAREYGTYLPELREFYRQCKRLHADNEKMRLRLHALLDGLGALRDADTKAQREMDAFGF